MNYTDTYAYGNTFRDLKLGIIKMQIGYSDMSIISRTQLLTYVRNANILKKKS